MFCIKRTGRLPAGACESFCRFPAKTHSDNLIWRFNQTSVNCTSSIDEAVMLDDICAKPMAVANETWPCGSNPDRRRGGAHADGWAKLSVRIDEGLSTRRRKDMS